ncbi:hypothetical protein [Streptomyces wuyuanensis]|uniref:hypothetical protein n=1 Tax=Streptomyces wuyuanensis TaxID=1196353 RepID=UPI003446D0BE
MIPEVMPEVLAINSEWSPIYTRKSCDALRATDSHESLDGEILDHFLLYCAEVLFVADFDDFQTKAARGLGSLFAHLRVTPDLVFRSYTQQFLAEYSMPRSDMLDEPWSWQAVGLKGELETDLARNLFTQERFHAGELSRIAEKMNRIVTEQNLPSGIDFSTTWAWHLVNELSTESEKRVHSFAKWLEKVAGDEERTSLITTALRRGTRG